MRATAPLLILLNGCVIVDGGKDSTPTEEVQAFPTCVIPVGATAGTSTWDDAGELELELHGTVEDEGTGVPPEGCIDANAWLSGGSSDASGAWWVVVNDGDLGRYTVAAATLGAAPDLDVGQEIYVSWTWQENSPFAGHYGYNELEIGDFEEATVAWVANGASLAAIHPPRQLSLARGDELYRAATDCYTEVGYALDATMDGTSVSLDFGESASLGGYGIIHGGTTASEDLVCSEVSGDQTHVALIR